MGQEWVPWVQGLKRKKGSKNLGLQGAIAVYLLGRVKVREAKQYLDKRCNNGLNWREMNDLEMAELCSGVEEWMQRERRNQSQEQEQHAQRIKHIQRILPELIRLLPDCPPHPSHPHLRQLVTSKLSQLPPSDQLTQQQAETLQNSKNNLDLIIGWQGQVIDFSEQDKKDERVAELLKKPSLRVGKQEIVKFKMAELVEKQGRLWEIGQRKVEQLFEYYCRESRAVPSTFEHYSVAAAQMDLRLFLKYCKDLQFQELNKFYYRPTNLTLLFRNNAHAGQFLDSAQFWKIHCKVFQLTKTDLTTPELLNLQDYQITMKTQQLQQSLENLQHLLQTVTQPTLSSKLRAFTLKTHSVSPPANSRLKEKDLHLMRSAKSVFHSHSSVDLGQRKPSFIRQVKRQIQNEEETSRKKKIFHPKAPKAQVQSLSNIPVSLPKILKLSQHEISNQGIYSSLKHFAPYDYAAQQAKIRSIIGLSNHEEPHYLSAFLQKEAQSQHERKLEEVAKRQERRQRCKQIGNTSPQHCRRYRPQEIQPYMRF